MEIGSLFLIFALLILVGLFVSRPFYEKKAAVGRDDHDLSALLAEKERTLIALRDLDFDFTLGKIPAEEYPVQRALLVRQGAEILRRIDALQGGATSESAERRLETIIAEKQTVETAMLSETGNRMSIHPDDPVEALIAARRRNRLGKAAGFCHKCGAPLQVTDRFCPKCGAVVAVARQESEVQ